MIIDCILTLNYLLFLGRASARGKQKLKKAPKVFQQVTTAAQKLLLDKMENNQKERDKIIKFENLSENSELNENLNKDEGELKLKLEEEVEVEEGRGGGGGGNIVESKETINEDKKSIKNLTFVSSLTFANWIMEFTKTEKKEVSFETGKTAKVIIDSSIPPPFSPLFNSPSSPSPSSTSLDAKGSAYGVELALLRREGTFMCMCICAHMYVHVHVYVHVYIHIYVCAPLCMSLCILCMHV